MLSVALPLLLVALHAASPDEPPRAAANPNNRPAGVMRGDTLVLDLIAQKAEWYPEADDGPHITVVAFGESGKVPSIPAPLIRVRTGTIIMARVRNALEDSTIHVIGLATQPVPLSDTLHLPPGGSTVQVFRAGAPGTYLYRAVIGHNPDFDEGGRGFELETAVGAFVVDPPEGSPPDRVFVLNIVAAGRDAFGRRSALGINGKSWPYTERVTRTVGDTVRWRVLNGSVRNHPMHLHGFYFRIEEAGTGLASRVIPDAERNLVVTESFRAWETRTLTWSPDRPGNWLFHCHLTFHVVPGVRLDHGTGAHEEDTRSTEPMRHMAGLVIGIVVTPGPGKAVAGGGAARRLDLYVNQGGPRGPMPATYSYILKEGPRAPSPDSVRIPGSLILLTRGETTDITVHNRGREPMGIHWHGIELESWSDGVAGWSNRGKLFAPAIRPGGSFTARLLLPRAGTFMYHTHINDIEQVTGGAAGPLLVLEPGERFDPRRDHVYIVMWNGELEPPSLLVNGDSTASAPKELAAGVTHRFRFINIGPAGIVRFVLRRDTSVVEWRARAKDGADLPAGLRIMRPANQLVAVGETFDFELTPPGPGTYELAVGLALRPPQWRQRLVVR